MVAVGDRKEKDMIPNEKSQSLEHMVYLKLEDEILSGELARGASLGEVSISKRLGVSRTPVRGALHRLAEDGLVEITPNKGAVVVGISLDDLVDIYAIRKRLEGLASASAAKRITAGDLASLEKLVALSEFYISQNDIDSLRELDTEFHKIIYIASGNRLLGKTLIELHKKIKSYRRRSLAVSGRLVESAAEHKEILAAIREGDSERADTLTSIHIQKAIENIIEHAQSTQVD